ncbi:MAG: hypothetical protein EHM21_09115, partial [Chloroflexi bacterium]
RRVLHLARLTVLCLVLVSAALLFWQSARGAELNPMAPRPEAYHPAENTPSKDPGQGNQVFISGINQALDLEQKPAPVVQRTVDLLKRIRRGAIYDRSGRELAFDRQDAEGAWERFYNEPSLAHVIGYVSGLRIGVTGLERSYNNTLLGLDRPDAQISQLLHRPIQGSDLILTLDTTIQRAAETALRDRSGAVVVLDKDSGAVLAMASSPRFDPNRIHDPGYLSELLANCSGDTGCPGALINRAAQSAYSPGSTWKTVSLIAALDSGQVQPDTVFDFGEPVQGPNGTYYIYTVDGGVIPDPNHREAQLDLTMSYARSANAAFAQIGDQMPADTLLRYARRLGFGKPGEITFPLEIEYSPSQAAWDTDTLYNNNLLRAATAIGQGEVLTSPLNIGMVVLSVLNDGRMPVPYFVQSVREPSGALVEPPNRHTIENIMQPRTARQVRQMMITTVEQGSGQKAAVPGLVVGGKTGTAQVGGEQPPHAWFAGFAETGERGVVIVVMVENGGEGSQTAAPIFAEVAQSAMREPGQSAPPPQPTAATQPEPSPTPFAAASATPQIVQPTQTPEPSPTLPPPTERPPPTATLPPRPDNVPAPEIIRDPNKKDITAENPSCGLNQEVPAATGEFIWPSPYQALSGGNFREGHPGFDLAAPEGSPVYAADTGLVLFAGWSGSGYGNTILIDHGNGFRTLYAHLSQVSSYCGAKVQKGKIIGLSGDTGNSTGPHLHFEVRVPGGYINPVNVLPVP